MSDAPSDTRVKPKGPRICLAGSGGGHVRQLLDLEPVWHDQNFFLVSEDTALGRTLQEQYPTYLLPHFAWGQLRIGNPLRTLMTAFKSFILSGRIILKERPQILVSEGAGAVYFAVLWAKLVGARIVIIESLARFEGPSLFGRLAAPLADDLIVQAPLLKKIFPKARVFDPLKILEATPPPKKPFVFVTAGATLPFDRMVEGVAKLHQEGAIPEPILIQTGVGGVRPPGLEVVEGLPFDEVKALLRDTSIVVCHGGTGSLITALREGCQVITMPRLAELGEHYDDHQAEITDAFEKRGLVQVANNVDELRVAFERARTRAPVMATSDPAELVAFLRSLLDDPRWRSA
ncbi:MAG: glycosyl transferase family 28 [Proteobacteria bacterium]|nr:glycosyl transferase family 28 [Pseudomonadota bacterium]